MFLSKEALVLFICKKKKLKEEKSNRLNHYFFHSITLIVGNVENTTGIVQIF